MCLAIPGKILSIDRRTPYLAMAEVNFGGIVKTICIEWVEAGIGDYILAHAGMAIARIDPLEAEATLQDLAQLSRL